MNWTDQPPAEMWRVIIDAAEYAAHGDGAGSAATLVHSDHDNRVLAITGIRLLAAVIAEGVPADDIRNGVLELASQTGAANFTVTTAMECVAMAEFLARDDQAGFNQLCVGSQASALDHAVMACALAGQTIAHAAVDPAGVFDRLRHQYGGAA